MSLKALSQPCGKKRITGTTTTIQYVGVDDIQTFPRSKYEINKDVNGYTAALGDTKLLTESFLFEAGKGWLDIDILVDSGNYASLINGEIGGQGYRNELPFKIDGSNPKHNEFVDCLIQHSGCMIFRVKSKSGYELILGTLENPVYVETISGDLTAILGFEYQLYCNTGLTAPIYQPDTSTEVLVDDNNVVFVDDNGNALGF